MNRQYLDTWQASLAFNDLQPLLDTISDAVWIGQRDGGFVLERAGSLSVEKWPSGRCFTEEFEIRWWPDNFVETRGILVLNQLPNNWPKTNDWHVPKLLAESPKEIRYLCIGEYDRNSPQEEPIWWETRYSKHFTYLSAVSPSYVKNSDMNGKGRAYLKVWHYELEDNSTQHRLVGFEPEPAKE